MENDRYNQWVENSGGLTFIDARLVGSAQGLGIIDVDLINNFTKLNLDSDLENDCIEKLRYITSAELWIMGAYELVSLIKRILSDHSGIYSKNTKNEARKTKDLFSMVRVPLAKFKKFGREEELHSGDARFLFHPEKGIGFRVLACGKGKVSSNIIYRQTLSDSLLNLLLELKNDIIKKQAGEEVRRKELLTKAAKALQDLLRKDARK